MSTTQARREEADGIVTVTFTRDEKLNAVSPEMLDVIAGAVIKHSRDYNLVRECVLWDHHWRSRPLRAVPIAYSWNEPALPYWLVLCSSR